MMQALEKERFHFFNTRLRKLKKLLTVEEDEELEEKFSKMSYLEKIRRGVAESLQSLESGDVNSIDLLW